MDKKIWDEQYMCTVNRDGQGEEVEVGEGMKMLCVKVKKM
jgi:hypothetical protein